MVFPLKIKVEVEEAFTQNLSQKIKKSQDEGPDSL